MKTRSKKRMKVLPAAGILFLGLSAGWLLATKCSAPEESRKNTSEAKFENRLSRIVGDMPGKFGVAVISGEGDTLTFNNSSDYPMMSMFKLHEAIAVCYMLDAGGSGLDSVISVSRSTLDPDTWSPMLKDYSGEILSPTVGELVDYILVHSDNNASNLLFERIVATDETDSLIRIMLQNDYFKILCKETHIKTDNDRSYDNRTSPLAYAALLNRVFTDSIVSPEKQEFIRAAMEKCRTGMSRIGAGLPEDVYFAHRTGSGYVNVRGEIVAVNDGGYVRTPSGKSYSIAVFVKDFGGTQADAEDAIARISESIYNFMCE